jgi:histidine triad (HIT) family protein
VSEDFYCDEVLSGRTPVERVLETEHVLAYHHTRPYWPVHIVVIPKRHIPSLLELGADDDALLVEMMRVVQQVADDVVREHGACRVVTNLGRYQDSKHLHWHVGSGAPLGR